MDYREESFRRKFHDASRLLDVRPDQIVSLKFRENVGSYEDYQVLVEGLQRDFSIQCSPANGDLQGRGYVLDLDRTRIILVEHETGLEILYIGGSIASLVALIPLIMQSWSAVRKRFWARGSELNHPLEIRRIDAAGHLQEEHLHRPQLMGSAGLMVGIVPMVTANVIDSEMRRLLERIEALSSRLDELEKQILQERKPVRQKARKTVASRGKGSGASKSKGGKRT